MTAALYVAVAQVFPLAAEIDFGPIGLAAGPRYRAVISLEFADGQKTTTTLRMAQTANAKEAAVGFHNSLLAARKWTMYQQGTTVVLVRFDGVPVTKVKIESTGAKPTVRWLPRPR